MTSTIRAQSATVVAFALLAAYGVLRWATMLTAPPAGRMAGLIALACLIAALGGGLHADRAGGRAGAGIMIAVAALAMIPMAGIPLQWFAHARVAATAGAIEEGISQLPGVLVPYRGSDPWTRAVIVLGAGMLMLGAALTLATSRRGDSGGRRVGEARLAGAALPLVVLATVPSALASPRLVWLHGLVTFALLGLFVLRERVPRGRTAAAAVLVTLAAGAALLTGPALAGHQPWISVTNLASRLGSSTERFNWSQTYGRLNWPRSGDTVLTVDARLAYYWKAENLDAFNGRAWVERSVGLPDGIGAVAAVNLDRWTQTLTVTLGQMSTRAVIAAGTALPPALGGAAVLPGRSPGTFVSAKPLVEGDRYSVTAYTPLPTTAELAGAGTRYPVPAIAPELTMQRPAAATVRDRWSRSAPMDRASGSFRTTAARRGRRRRRCIPRPTGAPGRSPSDSRPRPQRRTNTSKPSSASSATGSSTTSRRRPGAIRCWRSCSARDGGTASSSRARWHCCCGWGAFRLASPPASRAGHRAPVPAPISSPTSTPTRGSRPGSPRTAGPRSIRPRAPTPPSVPAAPCRR